MSDLVDLQIHNPKPIKWIHTLSGVLSLLVGGLVLLGWQFDIGFLKSLKSEWVSMKPNTAVCFMLVGLAWIANAGAASPISGWLSRVCASLVGLAGLLSLAEYLFKIDFGIDPLLFVDSPDAVGTSHLGRMAPDAAFCFMLLATAMWLSTLKRAIWHFFALAVLGALVASVALADILSFRTECRAASSIAYDWRGLTMMAVPTATLFVLLGAVMTWEAWRQSLRLGTLSGNAVALNAFWSVLLVGSLAWNLLQEYSHTLDAAKDIARANIYKDIRGGIDSTVYLASHLAKSKERFNALSLTHGTVWLFGLAGFGFAYRRELFLEKERQQTAEALQSNMERFRIAAESSNDLIYEWDIGQTVQWFGDIDGMLGYQLNEFPRTLQAWQDSLHPDDAESIMAALHAHVRQGAPYATEYRIQCKDGTYRWWSARGFTEKSPDGNLIRMIGTVTDITQRKQMEEKLRNAELRLRTLIESQIVGIIIADTAGVISEANDAFLNMLGYTREELEGGKLRWDDLTPPEHHANDLLASQQLKDRGIATPWEKEYLHKDGHRVPVLVGSAGFERDMGEVNAVCFVLDLTIRKKAELGLQQSEERFRAIFEQASIGVAQILSKTGEPVLVNKKYCEITGYSDEEMLHTSIRTIVHPDDLHSDLDNMQRLFAGEIPSFTMEKRYYHKQGHIVWVHLTVSPMWLPGQTPTYHIAIVEDITSRKQTEEYLAYTLANLERSNKELEQFAYIASHDLQEPLRMVASYTQLLAQHCEGQLDDKAQKYIGYAVDGAMRMQRLINDLLDYSRVQTQGHAPQLVNAEAVLADVVKNLSATLLENQAIIIHEGLPSLTVDEVQFQQLLQNLIGNAIKFRREEVPRVQVSARDCGHEWLFTVRDNGIGFEAKFAERIFQIFQRLHTRQKYPGTGIGLAICKRIVERHGGKISCDSTPGMGSTFYFTLPKSKVK